MVSKVDGSDEHSFLDVFDQLFNVLGVAEHAALDFFEGFNGLVALSDVLGNAETEPVVVESALVHAVVQRADLLLKQLLLHGAHLKHSVVVGTE